MASSSEELNAVMEVALRQAGDALVALSGRPIRLSGGGVEEYALTELQHLFGDPDLPVVASFLEIRGDMTGCMLLLFPTRSADFLLSTLFGQMEESEELVDSAVGEIGNVVGSSFLNALSDSSGMRILPSPPQVARDMMGALLGSVVAVMAHETTKVPLIRTRFESRGRHFMGYLVWLPEADQIRHLSLRLVGRLP